MERGVCRSRNFLLLGGGQFVSDLGGNFSGIAIPATVVLAMHATPMQIGALDAVSSGMIPLCATFAGIVADRARRRSIMILTNVVRALALLMLPLAFAVGKPNLWLFFGVAAVVAAASSVFDAAYAAFVPQVVGEAAIARGTSRLAMGASVAEAVGNGIAGALVMTVGAPLAIFANVATFVVSTLAMFAIRVDDTCVAPSRAKTSLRAEMRDGFAAIFANPTLRRVTCSDALAHFGGGMAAAVTTAYLYRDLHVAPIALGAIVGIANVGALAAFYAIRLSDRFGMRRTLAGAHLVSALGTATLPILAGAFPLVAIAASRTLKTGAGPVFAVNDATLRLSLVPDAVRGRATSTARTIVWTALPAGSLAGGFLGGHIGLEATMLVGAAMTACAALVVR